MPVSKVQGRYSEITLTVSVAQGRNLVAKDRALLSRRRTTSDPYVRVYWGSSNSSTPSSKALGQTAVVTKNCESPAWNATIQHTWYGAAANQIMASETSAVWCVIFDSDQMSQDDSMGVVIVPATIVAAAESLSALQWYAVTAGPKNHAYHCQNATGELQVAVSWQGKAVRDIAPGQQMPGLGNSPLHVGLAWDIQSGVGAVDLDSSVVAVDRAGNVDMQQSVYYANLRNPNQSLIHSGDDRTGEGGGDDETIMMNLARIPAHVCCLYFVLTVATPGKTLTQVTSAVVQFTNPTTGKVHVRFTPATESQQENTALVLVRLARTTTSGGDDGASASWTMAPISQGFGYARDFGSLIPELKGYTRDLIPDICIDPTERVAMLRKGGTVRVTDYLPGHALPEWLTLGLAWDITNGQNIDLDASAILLDDQLSVLDKVWFRHLRSEDNSIVHSGDEREGDEAGDDEKIKVNLKAVSKNVRYICFVLNSYSGQELDDVSRASCHLFDPVSHTEVAKYAMTNADELNRHTALLVACLYRPEQANKNDWRLWILAQPRLGRTVEDNVPDVVHFLRHNKPPPVASPIEDEIVVTAMPTGLETLAEEEEIAVTPIG